MDPAAFLKEDLGHGDITSDALIGDVDAEAMIFAKEDCILAGLEEAAAIFGHLGVETETDFRDGQKIGKSLGNALDPFACIERFGADAVRYYLLHAVPPHGDGDFSLTRLRELYASDLANGLGKIPNPSRIHDGHR